VDNHRRTDPRRSQGHRAAAIATLRVIVRDNLPQLAAENGAYFIG